MDYEDDGLRDELEGSFNMDEEGEEIPDDTYDLEDENPEHDS